MKVRALLVLGGAVCAAGVNLGTAGAAAGPAAVAPQVAQIRTSVALGTTIGLDGSFTQRITARATGSPVGWVVTYLPECGADPVQFRFPGGRVFQHTFRQSTVGDLCSGDGFELLAFNAAGGTDGSRHAVGTDWPAVVDDDAFVLHGPWSHGCSATSYGGCFVQTRSIGARATVSTNVGPDGPGYSTGIVGRTGPAGGLANVYVDGVRVGQVDFASRTVTARKVLFVLGAADFGSVRPAPTHTIALVLHAPGAFGGTTMTLDAVAIDSCCGD